jgi:outer membrane protein OmpA-like peptidoglycan-associated protein
MESISEITNSALQGNVLERLSAQIRENPSAIKRGLEHAVPASMAGLGSYASSESKAEELLGSFRSGDYPHMNGTQVQDVVGDPAATARLTQSSSGFIGRLFGDKQTAVVDAIAKQAGLSRSGASTVLGLATPLVLNAVGRETEERHLDARGLSRFLADQGRSVSGSLPGPLASAIGGAGALGAASAAAAPRGTSNPLHDIKERAHEMTERARGATSETVHRGGEALHRGRESAAERLHRGREYEGREYERGRERELGRDVRAREPHARRGTAWKLAALAVAAIAALFLFSRRNAAPDLPRPETPETPRAAAPDTERPNAERANEPAQQPPQQAQQPEQQAQAPEQQGQQGQPGQQAPEQPAQPQQQAQPQAQQGSPESTPAPQQPGGVAAETLSASGGVGALTTLLDGDETLPKRFVLEGVKFDTGSAQITDPAMLDDVAGVLKQHDGAQVRLDGYADSTGDAEANAKLSQDRADAVKQHLVDQGVDADNIQTAGESSDRPVASNDTAQGRAENRRVELVVTDR